MQSTMPFPRLTQAQEESPPPSLYIFYPLAYPAHPSSNACLSALLPHRPPRNESIRPAPSSSTHIACAVSRGDHTNELLPQISPCFFFPLAEISEQDSSLRVQTMRAPSLSCPLFGRRREVRYFLGQATVRQPPPPPLFLSRSILRLLLLRVMSVPFLSCGGDTFDKKKSTPGR